jgi:hypothetical protein
MIEKQLKITKTSNFYCKSNWIKQINNKIFMKFIPKMHPIVPDAKAENGSLKCVYIYIYIYIYICYWGIN